MTIVLDSQNLTVGKLVQISRDGVNMGIEGFSKVELPDEQVQHYQILM